MGETISVTALSAAPVKGLRIDARSELRLERDGPVGDRRFFLVDQQARLVNGKRHGALQQVSAELQEDPERLTLRFPDGSTSAAEIRRGEILDTRFYSERRPAHLIEGPFSAALSAHVGEPLRLVAAADGSSAVDRGVEGAVTLVSAMSISALADAAESGRMDARRFRMSIEIDGVAPFAEDGWVGRELQVGETRIALAGNVGRCIVTTMDPESGLVDEPTLDHLRVLRAGAPTTEPLPLGVHGEVREAGYVRIGDRVTLV